MEGKQVFVRYVPKTVEDGKPLEYTSTEEKAIGSGLKRSHSVDNVDDDKAAKRPCLINDNLNKFVVLNSCRELLKQELNKLSHLLCSGCCIKESIDQLRSAVSRVEVLDKQLRDNTVLKESDEYIDNDFELVILVCKDMEVWLKENLNVYSSSDQDGTNIHKLFQMINQAKERKIINSKTAGLMKKLGRWRNSLVHDSDVNSLSACGTSRQEFLSLYDQVKTELDHMHMQLYSAAQLVHCSRASSSGQESSSIGLLAAGVGVQALAGVALSSNEEKEDDKKRHHQGGNNFFTMVGTHHGETEEKTRY